MPKTENLYDALTTAEQALNALLSEQAAYEGQLSDAVHAGDSQAVIKMQRRHDELPHHITGARVAYLKARIAKLEAEALEDTGAIKPLAEAQAAAQEALDVAQTAYNEAFNRYANARQTARSASADLAAAKRQLGDVMREATTVSGPVVRSRPHAILNRFRG